MLESWEKVITFRTIALWLKGFFCEDPRRHTKGRLVDIIIEERKGSDEVFKKWRTQVETEKIEKENLKEALIESEDDRFRLRKIISDLQENPSIRFQFREAKRELIKKDSNNARLLKIIDIIGQTEEENFFQEEPRKINSGDHA